jgi:hypothetical protein
MHGVGAQAVSALCASEIGESAYQLRPFSPNGLTHNAATDSLIVHKSQLVQNSDRKGNSILICSEFEAQTDKKRMELLLSVHSGQFTV